VVVHETHAQVLAQPRGLDGLVGRAVRLATHAQAGGRAGKAAAMTGARVHVAARTQATANQPAPHSQAGYARVCGGGAPGQGRRGAWQTRP
jgi:hypothetical protein